MSNKEDDFPEYPGDEVILKAVGETLRQARLAQGMTEKQAFEAYKEAEKQLDPRLSRRAIALTIKNAREKAGVPRKELSQKSGVKRHRLVLIERALTDIGFTEFVRIAYALRIKPSELAEEKERIEKNIREQK